MFSMIERTDLGKVAGGRWRRVGEIYRSLDRGSGTLLHRIQLILRRRESVSSPTINSNVHGVRHPRRESRRASKHNLKIVLFRTTVSKYRQLSHPHPYTACIFIETTYQYNIK